MFKVCLYCNTVNSDSARFCRECGKTVFDRKTGFAQEGERYTGVIPDRVRKILLGVHDDDPVSCFELGKMYEFGDYYVKDMKKAFECYRAADIPESMYRLGFLYYTGMSPYTASGGEESTAYAYMTDAATRGNRDAIDFLKDHRMSVPNRITFCAPHDRTGTSEPKPKPEPKSEPKVQRKAQSKSQPKSEPKPQPKSEPKSEPKPKPQAKIRSKAAEKPAVRTAADEEELSRRKQFDRAMDAAAKDDAVSMNFLGYCYEKGYGAEQDAAAAMSWYKHSADLGCAAGLYNVGRLYAEGFGVKRDYAKAAEYYRKAAEQGDATAQTCLANCYFNGNGVERDYVQAAEYYRKAADAGNGAAQYNLGLCYQYGYGVKENRILALDLFFKAAEQGVPAAVKLVKSLKS